MEDNPPPKSFNKLNLFQNLLALSAATLIIIVWSIVVYLNYKNNLLQQKVNEIRSNTVNKENNYDVMDLQNWKTYSDSRVDFTFEYPSTWEAEELTLTGSGFYQDFKDKNEFYSFDINYKGNYNNETGKPFNSIQEYEKMAYPGSIRTIDSIEAQQYLPRAGGENENSVEFFTKDKKGIYAITLKTGKSPLSVTEQQILLGQKLFTIILSTIKFTGEVTPTTLYVSDWNEYKFTEESKPKVSVISPKLNETLVKGQSYTIKWTITNPPVDIENWVVIGSIESEFVAAAESKNGLQIFSHELSQDRGYSNWIVTRSFSEDWFDESREKRSINDVKYSIKICVVYKKAVEELYPMGYWNDPEYLFCNIQPDADNLRIISQ